MSFFHRHLGATLFFVFFVIGLFVYQDYGVAWDEPFQHTFGEVSYKYVFEGDKTLLNFRNSDHGVAFDLPLYIIEKKLKLKDSRDIYLMRHIVTHLFFLFSAFILFLLIDRLFNSKLLASIGFLMLVLDPRLYGQSFFNSKDIPFMSMVNIVFLCAFLAFQRKRYKYFIWLGIACGLTTSIRIMGVLFICFISLFFIIDFIYAFRDETKRWQTAKFFLVFIVASMLSLYASWPYLWEDPFNNFMTAFNSLSKFRWDNMVLLMGEFVRSTDLPWYYAPVWFTITNPIIYLAFGFFGMGLLIFQFIRNPKQYTGNHVERNFTLYFMCFLAPVLAVIILHSVLYDGWRHLFFIYPPFLMLAIYGLFYLQKTKLAKLSAALALTGIITTGYFMVFNHPYQFVFFNRFVPRDKPEFIRKNYEFDYWGVSTKQAMEYILSTDDRDTINIVLNGSDVNFRLILKPEDRKRIQQTGMDQADYLVTNYRWHPKDYDQYADKEHHAFKTFNSTRVSVFKLR